MNTDLVKGFRDYSGEEALKRAEIRKILVETFEKYGFEPAETPVIESEGFVKGENKRDEAVSDVYKLKDKGKRKLALRYEFTFQLKRIAKNKKLPYKRYEIGEVFRDEPVSSNRFRQFTQCDVDTIGSSIKDEAEILALTKEVFDKLGIKIDILIGNRNIIQGVLEIVFGIDDKKQIKDMMRYLDKLDKKKPKEIIEEMKKDAKRNIKILQMENIFLPLLNILKNLDIEKLKDYCVGILKKRNEEYLYESSKFKQGYDEIENLIKCSNLYGVELNFTGYLSRGLSYYIGNVFEIKAKNMKEIICAGGSYEVDGEKATGISFGLNRLSNLARLNLDKEKILVWPNGKDKEAIKIIQNLRKDKICEMIYKSNMKKVFEYANSKKFRKIIFYDKKSNKFKVKNMLTGKERKL